MALADDEKRRTSFGTVVDAARYDDLRPGYAEAAVRWLIGDPPNPLRVLDLAAGTGKMTRVLARLGHEVVAVDPSEGMLATLRRALTGADCADQVTVLVGTAEQIPLPDESVDAVTVGQAWHWMRPASAVTEIARVLRPGGVLGLAWNARDLRVPWASEFEEIVEGTGFAESTNGPWTPGTTRAAPDAGDWWPRVPEPLTAGERENFGAAQRLRSPQDVAALASTYSGIAVRDDREALLERVRALAAASAEPDGSVVLPLVCHCFRYRRP